MARSLRFLGCLALLLWSGGGLSAAEDASVASLEGKPVYADEYAFYADRLKASVASRLMQEHGVRQSAEFWNTPLAGVRPADVLREEALRAIARDRMLQRLAVEAGLLPGVKTYRQLVADFHAENRRRQEMKERGEVFYGPSRFRQEVWFTVYFDQLSRMLRKRGLLLPED